MEQKEKGKTEGQKMRCPMCGAEFTTQAEMDRHAKEAHQKK